MSRGFAVVLALALAATAGCATSVPAPSTASYQTVLGSDDRPARADLELVADHASYERGATISLALFNRGGLTYGRATASCHQPTAIWLRDASGKSYFARSGERRVCEPSAAPIPPEAAVVLADIDTALMWIDESPAERLYRVPAPLPSGTYSVHASTPIGELVTSIEIR